MRLDMRNSSVASTLKQMALQNISEVGEEITFTEVVSENETVLNVLLAKCNGLYTTIANFQENNQTIESNPLAQAAMIESFSLIHMLRQLITQQKMILNFAFEEEGPNGRKQLKKVEQSYESLISQDLITANKRGVFLRDKIKHLADDSLMQGISTKFYAIQNADSVPVIPENKVWEKIQSLTWFDLKGSEKPKGNKVEKSFNKNLYSIYIKKEKNEGKGFFQRYYGNLAFNNGWLWEWFSKMVISKQELLANIYYASDGEAIDLFFNADEVERDSLEGWKGGDYEGPIEYQQYQAKYQNQKLMNINSILTVLFELKTILSTARTKNGRIKKEGVKRFQDMFLSSDGTEQYLKSQEIHLQEIFKGLNQKININLKAT